MKNEFTLIFAFMLLVAGAISSAVTGSLFHLLLTMFIVGLCMTVAQAMGKKHSPKGSKSRRR